MLGGFGKVVAVRHVGRSRNPALSEVLCGGLYVTRIYTLELFFGASDAVVFVTRVFPRLAFPFRVGVRCTVHRF
jgi:hypothetical protein